MRGINNKKDIGLLIIRVVIGMTMFAFHGLPKITGGPETWKKIGESMRYVGIDFLPTAWGFAAAIVESLGAFLLVIGLWTRPTSLLLAFTMLIAVIMHLAKGDGWNVASHAIELMAVSVAFMVGGAGKYSVDKK